MSGVVVNLFSQQTISFSSVAAGGNLEIPLARLVNVSDSGDHLNQQS